MKNQISVREAITAEETARFWRELGAYHDRDIFANAESEEREYFHGSEYREAVQAAHDRAADPATIFSLGVAALISDLRSRRSSRARTASFLFWNSASCRSTAAAARGTTAPRRCSAGQGRGA